MALAGQREGVQTLYILDSKAGRSLNSRPVDAYMRDPEFVAAELSSS